MVLRTPAYYKIMPARKQKKLNQGQAWVQVLNNYANPLLLKNYATPAQPLNQPPTLAQRLLCPPTPSIEQQLFPCSTTFYYFQLTPLLSNFYSPPSQQLFSSPPPTAQQMAGVPPNPRHRVSPNPRTPLEVDNSSLHSPPLGHVFEISLRF